MTTTICAAAAVIMALAALYTLAYKRRSLLLVIVEAILAIALACAAIFYLPDPSSGCANSTFTIVLVAVVIMICLTVISLIAKYVIGIALLIGTALFAYWLYINGIMEGSILGLGISAWILIVTILLIFGAGITLKKALN